MLEMPVFCFSSCLSIPLPFSCLLPRSLNSFPKQNLNFYHDEIRMIPAAQKQFAPKAAAVRTSPRTRGTFSWMLHCMETTAISYGTQIRDLAQLNHHGLLRNTYFLQLNESEDFARRCFSAVVVFTLPVVGLVSICKS